VVATPHLSSFTDDGKRKMGVGVVRGVLDVLSGEMPEYIVNGEIWEKRRM
jgi:lactate dehydrogenase-like 2-hydroxyacid dehydrogenase